MALSSPDQNEKPSLAVLISGRGTNMVAIAEACRDGQLDAHIGLVISNRPEAKGLLAAKTLSLPTAVIDHTDFDTREAFDDAVNAELEMLNPSWIVLAGFMRILSEDFVNRWQGRILNIHPSLLPRYPGLNTHQRAIDSKDSEAGASVHVVTPELDAGPVIAQVRVPILSNDKSEELAKRVLAKEHQLYIDALRICLNKDSFSRSKNP